MSTENKQDTITVELPIKAHDDGYVSVTGVISVSREYWRKIAANPNATLNDMVRTIAPAVVAWIERDEFKPLDVPEVGRTIKATLRSGAVETFKVRSVSDAPEWVRVWKADSDHEARYIERTPDVNPLDRGPTDIIAWEYVDEFEPLDLPIEGRTIKVTLRDGRVETFKVDEVDDAPYWALVWKADFGDAPHYIQRMRDVGPRRPRDITAWEYVDEPALSLAEIADGLQAAVDRIREATK